MVKRIRLNVKVKKVERCKYFEDRYDTNGKYLYSCCMGQKNAPMSICNGDKSKCEIDSGVEYDKVETISKNSTI